MEATSKEARLILEGKNHGKKEVNGNGTYQLNKLNWSDH